MRSMKKMLCLILALVLLLGLSSCSPLSTAGRRISTRANIDLDISGCRIQKEYDTHGAMSDGEHLLILDCSGCEESIVKQTQDWSSFPLSDNLQELMYERGIAEQNGIPQISNGVWYFYDRFGIGVPQSDEFDRTSDEQLLTRNSYDFTLILYDADLCKLYYFEFDT